MSEHRLQVEQLNEVMGFELSEEQVAIATAPLEPNVIIAGAGTGKTTVMAARVVWLVGNGLVHADEVLGLTFTRKAAGELGERITKYLKALGVMAGLGGSSADDVRVSTYDSFAGQLVEEFGARIGVNPSSRLITSVQSHQLATGIVAESSGSFEWLSRIAASSITSQVLKLESDLQSHLCGIERLVAFQNREIDNLQALANPCADAKKMLATMYERSELVELVKLYRQRKADSGLLEFSDQMASAARIADELPQVGQILRERFRVVLLDEYQDTSAAQAFLLQNLFSGAEGSGRGHPVTAVGDPFQAIYGWRGAAAANIEQFETGFLKADGSEAESYPLTVNRRSGTRILEVANQVSTSLRASSKTEGTGNLVAPVGSEEGSLATGMFKTSECEIDWLAEEVIASHNMGTASSWKQIAVLVRRNADVSAIFSTLSDRDVPVEIVGLGGLLYLPEIANVVHTIRLCLDPAANYSTSALLSSTRWGIPTKVLESLNHNARSEVTRPKRSRVLSEQLANSYASVDPVDSPSLLEAIQRLVKLPPQHVAEIPIDSSTLLILKDFSEEITSLGKQVGLSPVDFCYLVIERQGLLEELAADPTSRRTRANQVHYFLKQAQEFIDLTGSSSLVSFLAYLDAAMNLEGGLELQNPSEDDSVKIMTVHKAKGLEMEVVFLPHMIDGVFPNDKLTDYWVRNRAVLPAPLRGDAASIPQLTGYEKFHFDQYQDSVRREGRLSEDRLAYVAFTRAKRVLNVTGHVWRPGLANPKDPSDYLKVLVDAVTEDEFLGEAVGVKGERNPVQDRPTSRQWPALWDPERAELLNEAAETIRRINGAQEKGGFRDAEVAAKGYPDQENTLVSSLISPGIAEAHLSDIEVSRPVPTVAIQERIELSDDENTSVDQRQFDDPHWERNIEVMREGNNPLMDPLMAELTSEEYETVLSWERQADLLIAEELDRRNPTELTSPTSLSTSDLISAIKNPETYRRELTRPMPRHISNTALLGTRFHEWIEHKFALAKFTESLIEETDPARTLETDEELERLIVQFESGPYQDVVPEAVEVPFVLALSDRQIRGRIDAVYRSADGASYQVVDWKTGTAPADPLQLACYRLAWAKAKGIAIEQVDAVFYQLPTGKIVRPDELLNEEELLAVIEQLPSSFTL